MTLLSIYSELYWITRLDGIKGFLIFMTIICCVLPIAILVGNAMSADFDEFNSKEDVVKRQAFRKRLSWHIRWMIPMAMIFGIIQVLVPTKNEYILIVAGGKTINWIKQDSSINKIPGQTTELIQQFLSNQIKELKK